MNSHLIFISIVGGSIIDILHHFLSYFQGTSLACFPGRYTGIFIFGYTVYIDHSKCYVTQVKKCRLTTLYNFYCTKFYSNSIFPY